MFSLVGYRFWPIVEAFGPDKPILLTFFLHSSSLTGFFYGIFMFSGSHDPFLLGTFLSLIRPHKTTFFLGRSSGLPVFWISGFWSFWVCRSLLLTHLPVFYGSPFNIFGFLFWSSLSFFCWSGGLLNDPPTKIHPPWTTYDLGTMDMAIPDGW